MSTERAALIAAIREAPDDDAPRLVCADWFEEQGDEASVARAEFIRIQVERARLPFADPRQSELEARELRLLKRYAPLWCGAHFCFRKSIFRRGFIEYVHLHLQHFLHHRRQLMALEPVRDVSLTGWHRSPEDLIRRVARCEEWQTVESLRIHHQGPHKSPSQYVLSLFRSPHLTRLTALHCRMFEFDSAARQSFQRLPILRQLTKLRLPMLDSFFTGQPGEWFIEPESRSGPVLGKLKSLALPYYSRADLLGRLASIKFWNRLQSLEIPLSFDAFDMLSMLRDRLPPGLKELRLSRSATSDRTIEVGGLFAKLAALHITALHIESVPVSGSNLESLLAPSSKCELRELTLFSTGIGRSEAGILAGSPRSEKLHWLNLGSNPGIDGVAAKVLFGSPHLRSVAALDVSYTTLGEVGARALAEAPHWDGLRILRMNNMRMKVPGLCRLFAAPNLRRVTQLAFGETGYGSENADFELSPELAQVLLQMPCLSHLRVPSMKPERTGEKIIEQADGIPWTCFEGNYEEDIAEDRARRSPERTSPVDEPMPALGTHD